MILKAYSVRDSKGEVYHTPYFAKTHGEAERNFTALARDPKSQVSQFPEDYDLFYLGEYDDNTGKFESVATPQHVTKAINVRAQ